MHYTGQTITITHLSSESLKRKQKIRTPINNYTLYLPENKEEIILPCKAEILYCNKEQIVAVKEDGQQIYLDALAGDKWE